MATLILNAVGRVIGRPLGGSTLGGTIGALVGRTIDGTLLRPARREGPRLTELAVQTSSYGSQVPKLFGTMRVAGTVIWATDLIESRATSGGGKGQPSVSTYSYAASFAVLLSARPVLGIGRIWAEGKLLRGAGGDFKTATGFRLHTGGEDQAVDPLIAAAEGGAMTPAHRGCAYAVFEGMALADYGNRIPSLTFEVIADPGPVPVAAIAQDVSDGGVSGAVALALDGFAAAGGSVGAVLAALAEASGAWFVSAGDGDALVMRDAAGPVAGVADAGVVEGQGEAGSRRTRTVAAIETVPRTMTLGYYDAARDYQAGLQRVVRPGAGVRDARVDVAAVIDAGTAKTIATGLLARAETARVRRTVRLGLSGLALLPGGCVEITGEPGVWRIVETRVEAMVTSLVLTPLTPAPLPVRGSSGRIVGAADALIGTTRLAAFETPGLEDAPLAAPRLSVAATGTGAGWRHAALLYSLDDGASWIAAGASAAPATIGTIAVVAGTAPATLTDRAGAFEVVLVRGDLALTDADAAALDAGGNLAMAGGELIQFGRAAPLGGGRWRLTQLLRGRRGTEAAIGTQAPGDGFVLISADSVRTIDLPVAAIGGTVRVMASGVGDAVPVETRLVLAGASVLPPSPVGLRATITADGGATLGWTRRSRAGWRWIDGGDVPLGEGGEAYAVTVLTGAGVTRLVETTAPVATLSAAERVAGAVRVEVRQRGDFGVSLPAILMV
ncbi:hypothetical protein IFT54_03400 [Sphingomonas sp. CFBP 13714]|uniref:phage tail protein n=1 Tax=Sphingomonas sp. CFBP 13714 TaxID=2775308 RepID=UPI001785D97B|nr:hypothetical protein [Sphingomonas sp. CFBP 13714]